MHLSVTGEDSFSPRLAAGSEGPFGVTRGRGKLATRLVLPCGRYGASQGKDIGCLMHTMQLAGLERGPGLISQCLLAQGSWLIILQTWFAKPTSNAFQAGNQSPRCSFKFT